MSETPRPTERELEEAFIKITFQDEREDQNKDPLYPPWTKQSGCTIPDCAFLCLSSRLASTPWSEPFVYA